MLSLAAPWWAQPTEWAAPSTDWPPGALVLPIDCPLSSGTYTVQPWGTAGAAAVGPVANVPGYVGIDLASAVQVTGNFTWLIVASAEYVSVAGVPTFSLERSGALGTVEFSLAAGRANVVLDNNVGTVMTGDYTVPTVFVFTRIGNQIRSYVNGEFKGTAVTGTRTGAVTGVTFGRTRSGLNNPGRTIGELQWVTGTGLSDDEIRVLSSNAWQLFAGASLSIPSASVTPTDPTGEPGALALRGNIAAATQVHFTAGAAGVLSMRGNVVAATQVHIASGSPGSFAMRGNTGAATQVHFTAGAAGRMAMRGNTAAASSSTDPIGAPGLFSLRGNTGAATQVHTVTGAPGRITMRGNVAAAVQGHFTAGAAGRMVLRGNQAAAFEIPAPAGAPGVLSMRGNTGAATQVHITTGVNAVMSMQGNTGAASSGPGLGEVCAPYVIAWQDNYTAWAWQDNYTIDICGTNP